MQRAKANMPFRQPGLARFLAFCLILPFVFLSLFAQGTMAARSPVTDTFMVVLCSGHAPVAMALDRDGNVVPVAELEEKSPVPHDAKPPCDWAVAHGQPILNGAPAWLAQGIAPAFPAFLSRMIQQRQVTAQVLRPLARGPPIL